MNAIPYIVDGIAEGPDGKMYFPFPYQMAIYDGENTQTVGTAEGYPFDIPRSIAVGADNSVWIGTYSGMDVYHPG